MTKDPLNRFRRQAKALRRDHEAGDPRAVARLRANPPRPEGAELKHADYLHVIARENRFASWPHLKLAVETEGLDRAGRQQRLGIALVHGQEHVVRQLLEADPSLPEGNIGLACRLYLRDEVARLLAADPAAATRKAPLAPPLTMMAPTVSAMFE